MERDMGIDCTHLEKARGHNRKKKSVTGILREMGEEDTQGRSGKAHYKKQL